MWKQILKTTLIAGTLDITAACIQAYVMANVVPGTILKYISSGVMGPAAYQGGFGIMVLGLFFHFLIVFFCTVIFFKIYPCAKFFRKSVILNSLLIALVAWAVTTQLIIPLSEIKSKPFDLSKASVAIAILFFCIGLPISVTAKNCYNKN